MKYLNERAEAWAAIWIPSVFFGRIMDNLNDWMEWCVPYISCSSPHPVQCALLPRRPVRGSQCSP
eukprot:3751341-Pyramimonas_sp.AAC.1